MKTRIRPTSRKIAGRNAKRIFFEAMEARVLMTALVAWDVSSLAGGSGNFGPSPYAPTSVDSTSVTNPEGLTRGAGIGTTGSAAARAWGGVNWTGAADNYVEFGFTVAAGRTVSVGSIDESYRRSGSGPASGVLEYQLGGGSFTAAANLDFSSSSSSGATNPTLDLSAVASLQNIAPGTIVTFRIVPTGGGSAGTWYVFDTAKSTDPDLAINGTSAPAATGSEVISLASNAASVTEGNAVTITVNRSAANGTDLSGTVTVPYTLTDGSAVLGTNYGTTGQSTGVITLNPGDASGSITINTDAIYPQGGDKTFTVTLGTPTIDGQTSGVAVDASAPTAATVTIVDNAETVNLTSATYTVNDTAGNAVVSVVRTGNTDDALSVNYTTTGAVSTSGSANFAAGASVATFTVAIPDVSGNQTFNIALSAQGENVALGTLASAADTIVDAAAITNTLAGADYSGAQGTFVTDIETSGPYTATNFATVVGDTTAGTGSFHYLAYEVLEFSPTITPSLYPAAGASISGIQSLSLQLFNTDNAGDNYSGHAGNFNVYFISDMQSPTSNLIFDTNQPTGIEGQAGAGAATLLGTFSFDNNTGYDTFTAAALSPAIASAITDALNNGVAFRLAVTPTTTGVGAIAADWQGASTANPPIVSLATTQTAETFKIDGSNTTVSKSGGALTITVDRSSTDDLSDAATIHYSLTPGNAVAGTDYADGPDAGTVTFAAGESRATFAVSILDYAAITADKSFTVTLTNPATGDSSRLPILGTPASETITIHDPRTVTVSANSNFNENATVQPAGPSTGTAGISALDIAGSANGANAAYGVVDFNDPADPNPAELYTLPAQIDTINGVTLKTVNYPDKYTTSGPVNVYIVTDPASSIANDGSSTLTFDTTEDPVEGLGSQLGNKYLLGTINFDAAQPGGSNFTSFDLTTLDPAGLAILKDALDSNSKFRIAITPENSTVEATWNGSYDTLAGVNLSPIIAVNYTPVGTVGQIGFPQASYSANEADGVATIVVHRDGSSGVATVDYATSDGSAHAGTDYTATSGTLTFADGMSAVTFTIPLTNVSTDAGTKTVNITLSNPSNATLDAQSTATLTITDNQAVSATAPAVVSTRINDGSPQRSNVQSFSVTFNEAVNFNSSSFSVLQQGTDAGGNLNGSSTNVSGGFTAASTDGITWTITVNAGGSMDRSGTSGFLKDGVYQLVLNGNAITDAATGTAQLNSGGAQVAAFNPEVAGGSDQFFHALYGDLNGSGTISGADNLQFARTFNLTSASPSFNANLDFNGDGQITGTDNIQFGRRFNTGFHY